MWSPKILKKMWMAQDAAIHNYTDKVGSAIADKNLIDGKYSTFLDKLQVFLSIIYNFNTVRADIKHQPAVTPAYDTLFL